MYDKLDIISALSSCNVIVFFETVARSGKYEQMMLNLEQFKAMTKTLSEVLPQHKDGGFNLTTNDEVIFEGEVKPIYSDKEITNLA